MTEFKALLNTLDCHPVLDISNASISHQLLDLSIDNQDLIDVDVSSSTELGRYIHNLSNIPTLYYGGYLENRAIYYRSSHFDSTEEKRDIHIGVDLWYAAGTPVFSPIDGKVHSMALNEGLGNYGPTIILEHSIDDFKFYTLYGHLDLASLDHVQVSQQISKGEVIGWLGDKSVNGDYPPHLHFQVIKDIGNYKGDYPGVCCKSKLEYYKFNCPDPLILLKYLK